MIDTKILIYSLHKIVLVRLITAKVMFNSHLNIRVAIIKTIAMLWLAILIIITVAKKMSVIINKRTILQKGYH